MHARRASGPRASNSKVDVGNPAEIIAGAGDRAGNMVRADNMAARIRRSYSPAGLLLTDTLRTRILRYESTSAKAVAQDFTSHAYGIRHEYDQAGRPAKLWHPATLAECGTSCPA